MSALAVGDRVRVTTAVETCPAGTTGVVIDLRKLDGYDVVVGIGDDALCFKDGELERVEPPAAARVYLTVAADIDGLPDTTAESWRDTLQVVLAHDYPWFRPVVTITDTPAPAASSPVPQAATGTVADPSSAAPVARIDEGPTHEEIDRSRAAQGLAPLYGTLDTGIGGEADRIWFAGQRQRVADTSAGGAS